MPKCTQHDTTQYLTNSNIPLLERPELYRFIANIASLELTWSTHLTSSKKWIILEKWKTRYSRSRMLPPPPPPEHSLQTYRVDEKTLHGLCCCTRWLYTSFMCRWIKTNEWLCIHQSSIFIAQVVFEIQTFLRVAFSMLFSTHTRRSIYGLTLNWLHKFLARYYCIILGNIMIELGKPVKKGMTYIPSWFWTKQQQDC